jgi:hypothetical protein
MVQTLFLQKFKPSWDNSVVFLLPVPPERMVNSDVRSPLTFLLKNFILEDLTFTFFYKLRMRLCTLSSTFSKLRMLWSGMVFALLKRVLISDLSCRRTSLASYNFPSELLKIKYRFAPSFDATLLAFISQTSSLSIHK